MRCPYCGAEFHSERRRFRDTAAAVGGMVGIIRGIAMVLSGREGKLPSTGHAQFVLVVEVILGGLVGAAEGSAAGAVMGEAIEQFMPTLCCPRCETPLRRSRSNPLAELE